MPNTVQYRGQLYNGPSPDLWSDCPVLELLENPAKGQYFHDDFTNCPTWTAPAATLVDKYHVYGSTGVILGPSGEQGGGLRINIMDSDNDEGSIQVGGGGFVIPHDLTDAKKLWFEGRIKATTLGAEDVGMFLGLFAPGNAADNFLVDNTGAIVASKSYLGFFTDVTTPTVIQFVYADAAGSVHTWAANVGTLVAATYKKLGFKYDPDNDKRIRVWIDGVEYTTDYIDSTDIAAATFPGGNVMAPIFGAKTGEAADDAVFLKWWRCAQLAAG